jgi:hypothetical protein
METEKAAQLPLFFFLSRFMCRRLHAGSSATEVGNDRR